MDPTLRLAAAACALAVVAVAATAQTSGPQGKLLLTSGVSSIDGAAGGGLTPWALTASHATTGQVGASAFVTRLRTQDYALSVQGVALGFGDRLELSLARQDFDTGDRIAPLGFPGLRLQQTIVGAKLRLAGDAVLDSDRWHPQLALGVQHKRLDVVAPFAAVLQSLGARDHGTDVYLSATKLFLAQGVLANLTLRATRANQNGLLGFGGTARSHDRLQPEASLALLLRKDLAIGAEFRAKPDNLNPSVFGDGLREDDWRDVF
ncbi:MAG: DUF3034 family protein, partial [Rubrivivax sp.]|nr:DUF3034 family protein [Rubrivivax sp.]